MTMMHFETVRRSLMLALGCCVLLLVGAPPAAQATDPPKKQPGVGYNKGDLAPELKLTDQNDNPVSLAEYRGKNVLLLFSAMWCGPCQAAAQISEAFVDRLNAKGEPTELVEVLVENLYGDPSETIDAVDWAEAFDLSTPVLSSGGDYKSPAITQFFEYSRRYGGPAYPTTVLISPHGRIISAYTGFPGTKVQTDFLEQRAYTERNMVDHLLTNVERLKLGNDLTTSLGDPLRATLAALDRRQWDAACEQMAAFVDQVRAQNDTTMSDDAAKQLTEAAQKIQEELGCE
jgi:thiol-disulfide isomerase/thioredoxin